MKYKVKQNCVLRLKDKAVLAGEIIEPREGTSDGYNISVQLDKVELVDGESKKKTAKIKANPKSSEE